jgi:hypothetical protein
MRTFYPKEFSPQSFYIFFRLTWWVFSLSNSDLIS